MIGRSNKISFECANNILSSTQSNIRRNQMFRDSSKKENRNGKSRYTILGSKRHNVTKASQHATGNLIGLRSNGRSVLWIRDEMEDEMRVGKI